MHSTRLQEIVMWSNKSMFKNAFEVMKVTLREREKVGCLKIIATDKEKGMWTRS